MLTAEWVGDLMIYLAGVVALGTIVWALSDR